MESSENKSEKIKLKKIATNNLGDLIIQSFNLEENEFSYQNMKSENSFELSIKSYHETRQIIDERQINTIIKTHHEQKKYNILENSQYMIFTNKNTNTVKVRITKETHHGKEFKDLYESYNIKVWEENPARNI